MAFALAWGPFKGVGGHACACAEGALDGREPSTRGAVTVTPESELCAPRWGWRQDYKRLSFVWDWALSGWLWLLSAMSRAEGW